jgi:hypothetical protein
MMGQGLAQALAGAGAAVNSYMERKEQKAFKEQTVSNLSNFLKQNPDASKELGFNIDPSDKKQVEAAVKGFGGGDFNKGSALANQLVQQFGAQKAQQAALRDALAKGGDARSVASNLFGAGAEVGQTAALVNAIANSEQTRSPDGISLGKFMDVRNGQKVEVTIDQNTGKEIAVAPVGDKPQLFESAVDRAIGEEVVAGQKALIENSNKALNQINKLDEVLAILETGNPQTGIFSEVLTNLNRVRSKFLGDKAAGRSVTDTQLLDALLGSDVFPLIGELGIGARGIDTPAERDFLRNVFTGTQQLDKTTLIDLTEMRRKKAAKAIEEYNNAVEGGKFKRREEIMGSPMPKLSVPARANKLNVSENISNPSQPLSREEQAELDQLRKRFGR